MAARYRIYKFDTSGITGGTDNLNGAITSSATTITLVSGSTTVNGTVIQIDSERLLIVSGAGTATPTVTRAWGGTTAASHLDDSSVSIPGALVYNLLQIATCPNQSFTFANTSTDINYVTLVPFSGDTLPGGAASIILADSSSNYGTAVLTAPDGGNAWIVTAGAGGSGASGAAGADGGSGTAAPNITSATGAPAYSLLGNSSVFGFAGVITLPTTDPNYSDLATITVSAFAPGSTSGVQIAQLTAPFTGSTVNYSGGQFPQPSASQTWSLQFVCTNPSGSPTATPVSINIAVSASGIASLTGGDASALSTSDPKYVARTVDAFGSPHTAIWYIPVITGGIYPQVVSTFYNPGDGSGWQYMASVTMTTAGQVFYMPGGTYVPTLGNETWQLAAVTGFVNANGSVTLPAAAVDSATFTVLAVGSISPTEFALAFQNDPSNGTLYLEAGPFNPGYYTWSFYELAVTFPAVDVNLWDVRLTAQEGYVVAGVFTPSTTAQGTERQFCAMSFMAGGDSVQPFLGTTVNVNGPTAPVSGVQVPDWTWPTVTTNWVTRIRAYAVSRLGTGATGGSGTQTLITGWPGAADHFDLTPAPPAAALNASALVSGVVSPALITSVNASAIAAVNASAITSVNASAITSVNASAITSVNAAAITGGITSAQITSIVSTKISGSITAAQITSITAAQITGSITSGQISSVNASALSGTITSGQIGSVNTATITVGTLSFSQIGSVSASSVSNGQLVNTQIASVSTSTLTGQVVAAQIASVSASTITGSISAAQIGSVNASAISGTLTSTQIGSINAATINIGLIGPSQISSVNVSQLNAGTATFSGTVTLVAAGSSFSIILSNSSITLTGPGGVSMMLNSSGTLTMGALGTTTELFTNQVNSGTFNGEVGFFTNSVQVGGTGLYPTQLQVNYIEVINNLGTFVGAGVVCTGYGVAAAGFNPFVGGTQYDGITTSFQDLAGNTHLVKGGVIVS